MKTGPEEAIRRTEHEIARWVAEFLHAEGCAAAYADMAGRPQGASGESLILLVSHHDYKSREMTARLKLIGLVKTLDELTSELEGADDGAAKGGEK